MPFPCKHSIHGGPRLGRWSVVLAWVVETLGVTMQTIRPFFVSTKKGIQPKERFSTMAIIPDELRATIAHNIRACRLKKFPGRGGSMKCAAALGVSPQQLSQWERGNRSPEKTRLDQIAAFFGVSPAWLHSEHAPVPSAAAPLQPATTPAPPSADTNFHLTDEAFANILNKIDLKAARDAWAQASPGSAASFFYLARFFVMHMQRNGLRIDRQCLEYLATLMK